MRYYRDAETKKLRTVFEDKVLRWPEVSTTKMFGCPCYQVRGKLFAFLVTNGIVITQLEAAEKELLSRKHAGTSFQAGRKTVERWLTLSVRSPKALDRLIPSVRKSYKAALLHSPRWAPD